MNLATFGIENPEVRALGELAELERRQVGFEQLISDSVYNGDLDILVEEIEYDLEETLDRFEEIKSVLKELGETELTKQLAEVKDWISKILKDLNSINIFDIEDEGTIHSASEVLQRAFELNTYFLHIEEKLRQRVARDLANAGE